jgi:phosphoribosylamine-glycine ligase
LNILLIGSGGREHAMARAIVASPLCTRLVTAPGNPAPRSTEPTPPSTSPTMPPSSSSAGARESIS